MPHMTIEYSANLEQHMSIDELLNTMHGTAANIEGIPVPGLRTRAARRDVYAIADSNPANAFIHVMLKLGHGRTVEVKHAFGQCLFDELCKACSGLSEKIPLALSLEILEIDAELTWKKNGVRQFMQTQA